MNKKVVVLIDGQNLFYVLKSIGLKEAEINWTKLFSSFLEQGDELIRAYWFRPQRIVGEPPSPTAIRNKIAYNHYSNYYHDYKNGNLAAIPSLVQLQIEDDAKEVERWLYEQKAKFSNIEYAYDQLCLDNMDIEIVKKGILRIDPYQQEYSGEKGVDMALAVKMMSLSVEGKCNKIILISGDYDYAEAINYVKNNMTKVHLVKLHKGHPPKNKNMSRDLSVLADKVIDLYESGIRENYLRKL